MTPVNKIARFTLYALLTVMGSIIAWNAAPDIEAYLFPIYVDEYLMPFDPARPDVLVERQLDRACWRMHIRKVRAATAYWRSIAIVTADGTRYFREPLDGRTGQYFSSKDAVPRGFNGNYTACVYLSEEFDASQAFKIESFGQYKLANHYWLLDHTFPIINVPAAIGGAQ